MDPHQWQRIRRRVLWASATIALLLLLAIAILVGYRYDITLWDWLKLLVVPAVIAAGGIWFNRQQRERELEIAERRAQDEALQAYLNEISQLLTDKERPLRRAQWGDDLSYVARARTLTVLPRLDGEREARVVQFLYESVLIAKKRLVLDLQGADLSGAYLFRADLELAFLVGTYLDRADLIDSNLFGTDLRGALLRGADLRGANLIETDLSGANVSEAQLRDIYLGRTVLPRADLRHTDVTEEQLEQAQFLDDTTMPNGQKYEDWLKDKEGSEEDAKTG